MLPFTVVELRLGGVGRIAHGRRSVRSAIAKTRTSDPVTLGPLGFTGDAVADTKNHGGVDKAVCVYAASRYEGWGSRLGTTLARPAFGENLLVDGVDEDDVHVGDVFTLGTAVLTVSQPRVPCYKPAAHTGERRLTVDLRTTGWTGWYLRVVEPGVVREGDVARPRERLDGSLSVSALNALRYGEAPDPAAVAAAATTPGLTDDWRRALLESVR